MERHALLRHFLHRCVTKGLSDAEVDLLTQFKLNGNAGDEIAEARSVSSNALRQKMKRYSPDFAGWLVVLVAQAFLVGRRMQKPIPAPRIPDVSSPSRKKKSPLANFRVHLAAAICGVCSPIFPE